MTPPIPFKTRYNHNPASERDLTCGLPSLTDQQFKDDADINVLCARYRERGYYYNPLAAVREKPRMPQFGDFSRLPDLGTALSNVAQAQEMFMRLPAEVREACGHDPAAFIALEKNPQMQELLKKYGLVPASSGVQGNNSPATAQGGVPNPSSSNEPVSASNPKTSA